MAGTARLDRVYADQMLVFPFGWALYKKAAAHALKPGSCGYFDAEGDWHIITQLADVSHKEQIELGPVVPQIELFEPDELIWGPKKSTGVSQRKIGGAIGVTAVIAPIEPSVTCRFEAYKEQGAVLVTEEPVVFNRIKSSDAPLLEWMRSNYKTLLKSEPHRSHMKDFGIWIITKTYTTKRCCVAVMTSKESTVEIGLSASVEGLLTLDPSVTWSRSTTGSSVDMHQDPDGVVVFMSGMFFKKRALMPGLAAKLIQERQKPFLRGDSELRPEEIFIAGTENGDEDELLGIQYYGKN